MKKIAYIIPGYQQSYKKQKGYNKIAGFFKEKGIDSIHLDSNWNKVKTGQCKNYADQFFKKFKRKKCEKIYVWGFSFGAVVAFLTAAKIKPDILILCSLSPYFREDLVKLRPAWLKDWNKNFKNNDYSFNEIAKNINAKTFVISGDREGIEVERRARAAKRLIKNSSLFFAKGARHNINQKEYLDTIKKIIYKLP